MKLTKSFAGIVAASALSILSAAPASAATATLGITGGTLTTTTLGTYTLGPTGTTGPCTNYATDTDTITIDETGGATTMTAMNRTSSVSAGNPAEAYAVLMTKHTGTNTGTIGTTSPYAITQNISIKVEYFHTTGAPTCALSTKLCTMQINGTLNGNASNHPLTTSTTVTVTGTGLATSVPFQTCAAPFATLLTTTVSLTLNLHVI